MGWTDHAKDFGLLFLLFGTWWMARQRSGLTGRVVPLLGGALVVLADGAMAMFGLGVFLVVATLGGIAFAGLTLYESITVRAKLPHL